ncbi:hypothetical protein LYSBPC_12130 [Lysinibacillus piscis]|uniref:DUF3221 domain-containing protein n=2 Tax=Lysinibacillus piscis TaxID=2518931 RepID=A0ABQ5NJ49_9BACI|nr:hypothetical protein LYSBPC_12130 [Lysinibacillus sp. KH24]
MMGGCATVEKTTELDYSTATNSGYVTAIHDIELLVVDDTPKYIEGRDAAFFNACWFSSQEKVDIGDYVHVFGGDAELLSYPCRTNAVKIIFEEKNKNTTLTTKEVVQRAINSIETIAGESYYSPILTKIHYDKKTDTWRVRIQNSNSQKPDLIISIGDI